MASQGQPAGRQEPPRPDWEAGSPAGSVPQTWGIPKVPLAGQRRERSPGAAALSGRAAPRDPSSPAGKWSGAGGGRRAKQPPLGRPPGRAGMAAPQEPPARARTISGIPAISAGRGTGRRGRGWRAARPIRTASGLAPPPSNGGGPAFQNNPRASGRRRGRKTRRTCLTSARSVPVRHALRTTPPPFLARVLASPPARVRGEKGKRVESGR